MSEPERAGKRNELVILGSQPMQQALTQSLAYLNARYSDIADIDFSKFFDEVLHYKILQLIQEKVK